MQNQSGFTLVEIMIVVAIVGILASIAIPNFSKNVSQSKAEACIQNMRQIETALENYRTVNEMRVPENLSGLVGLDNYLRKVPECPSGGTYTFTPAVVDEIEKICVFCSYGNGHVQKW